MTPAFAAVLLVVAGQARPSLGAELGSLAGDTPLVVQNASGTPICFVNFSSTEDALWGPDRLASTEIIGPGQSRAWNVRADAYDLRLRDCDQNDLAEQGDIRVSGPGVLAAFQGPGDLVLGPIAAPASGATSLLRVHNAADRPICYVHFSSTQQTTWGPDRLGADEVITPGASRDWQVPVDAYDLRFLDCGQEALFEQGDIRVAGGGVLVTYEGPDRSSMSAIPSREGPGGAQAGQAPLSVHNTSEAVICFVNFSTTDDTRWGDDRLGDDEVIAPGQTREWTTAPGAYDIRLLDCDLNTMKVVQGAEVPSGRGFRLSYP